MALVLALMLAALCGAHSASPALPNSSDTLLNPSDTPATTSDTPKLETRGSPPDTDPAAERSGPLDVLSNPLKSLSTLLDGSQKLLDAPKTLLDGSRKLLDAPKALLDAVSIPLDALSKPLDTGSKKVRRSVLEDMKQLLETQFSALLDDGIKRISGKKGILNRRMKPKNTPRLLILENKKNELKESRNDVSEEVESQNPDQSHVKVLTDDELQDPADVALRNIVDELLGEDDKTIEQEMLDNSETNPINTENLTNNSDEKTIEDIDDSVTSDIKGIYEKDRQRNKSKKDTHFVVEHVSKSNKNDNNTERLENILDLDVILKSALGLSDSLSQDNVNGDDNLSNETNMKQMISSSRDDGQILKRGNHYQETDNLKNLIKNNSLKEYTVEKLDDDVNQVDNGSNININEHLLNAEDSSRKYRNKTARKKYNQPAVELNSSNNSMEKSEQDSNLISTNNNKIVINSKDDDDKHNDLKTRQPISTKLNDLQQSIHINLGDNEGKVKETNERNNHKTGSTQSTHSNISKESITQDKVINGININYNKNQPHKVNDKYSHKKRLDYRKKKHHKKHNHNQNKKNREHKLNRNQHSEKFHHNIAREEYPNALNKSTNHLNNLSESSLDGRNIHHHNEMQFLEELREQQHQEDSKEIIASKEKQNRNNENIASQDDENVTKERKHVHKDNETVTKTGNVTEDKITMTKEEKRDTKEEEDVTNSNETDDTENSTGKKAANKTKHSFGEKHHITNKKNERTGKKTTSVEEDVGENINLTGEKQNVTEEKINATSEEDNATREKINIIVEGENHTGEKRDLSYEDVTQKKKSATNEEVVSEESIKNEKEDGSNEKIHPILEKADASTEDNYITETKEEKNLTGVTKRIASDEDDKVNDEEVNVTKHVTETDKPRKCHHTNHHHAGKETFLDDETNLIRYLTRNKEMIKTYTFSMTLTTK